jgi:hypothetical protein
MPPGCEVVYAVVNNPALTGDQVMGQIRSVIDGVARADTWLREHPPRIDYPVIHRVLDPVHLPLDHEAVAAVANAYPDALGRQPELGRLPRLCDARHLGRRRQDDGHLRPGGSGPRRARVPPERSRR